MEHKKLTVTCDFNEYNEITIDDNSTGQIICIEVSSQFSSDLLITLTKKDASRLARRLNQFASRGD